MRTFYLEQTKRVQSAVFFQTQELHGSVKSISFSENGYKTDLFLPKATVWLRRQVQIMSTANMAMNMVIGVKLKVLLRKGHLHCDLKYAYNFSGRCKC